MERDENGRVRGRHQLRVRYQETDCAGVVYHANYLNYFEVARTELLRSLGLPYRSLEETGIRLTVVDARARFLKPAYYDDHLEIDTRIIGVSGARVEFEYRIERIGDGVLVTTGSTVLACIDGERGRARRLPRELLDILGR